MTSTKINFLNFTRADLRAYFLSIGETAYRADQLIKWIHHYGVTDFDKITNISKSLRAQLKLSGEVTVPEIAYEQQSKDGTYKWLLKLSCGNCIETVYIPEGDRGTLCVSSQVGCGLTCTFCSTGRQGFNRNLTTAEVIGQVWIAVRQLSKQNGEHDHHITNIVMMGMGEPLLNFDNVVKAMDLMLDDFAYGLSKHRVTLSTSGLIPAMEKLAELTEVSLAVSLHAPTDELRDILVPVNKKYPIKDLMAVCKSYFKDEARRKVTFEYVMIDHVNDSVEQARQLVKVLEGVPCKLNLIPFNPFPGTQYKRSSQERIDAFRNILVAAGVNTITRKTRGDDIDAACGQLVGQVKDKTKRSQRLREQELIAV